MCTLIDAYYNSTRLASQDSNTLEYYTREICNYSSIFREFQKNRTVDLYAFFCYFVCPKKWCGTL